MPYDEISMRFTSPFFLYKSITYVYSLITFLFTLKFPLLIISCLFSILQSYLFIFFEYYDIFLLSVLKPFYDLLFDKLFQQRNKNFL